MNATSSATSYEKPLYYLKFTVAKTGVDVRLNDIPVLSHSSRGTTNSEKPVPESIVDGENDLVVTLSPLEDDEGSFVNNSSAEVSLIVREKGAVLSQYETLLHLDIDATAEEQKILSGSGDEKGDTPRLLSFNEKEIVAERSVTIDSPYPRWEWQDGVTITDSQENYDSLLEEYKDVYEALESEDISEIKQKYDKAAQEFAAAYHYDDPDEGHRIMSTGGLAGDDEWALGNLYSLLDKGHKFELDIYANGKLARLLNQRGKEGAIVYLNREVKMASYQKFGFYKSKDDEWIMIR